jgi:hypothetical protein
MVQSADALVSILWCHLVSPTKLCPILSVHTSRIYAQLLHCMLYPVRKKDQCKLSGTEKNVDEIEELLIFVLISKEIIKHEKTSGMVDDKVDDSASKKSKKRPNRFNRFKLVLNKKLKIN